MESEGITIQVKASVSTISSYCSQCSSVWFHATFEFVHSDGDSNESY